LGQVAVVTVGVAPAQAGPSATAVCVGPPIEREWVVKVVARTSASEGVGVYVPVR
jgi:hypothetical protein